MNYPTQDRDILAVRVQCKGQTANDWIKLEFLDTSEVVRGTEVPHKLIMRGGDINALSEDMDIGFIHLPRHVVEDRNMVGELVEAANNETRPRTYVVNDENHPLRPQTPPPLENQVQFRVNCTKDERATLRELAKMSDMSVSDFVMDQLIAFGTFD